MLKKKAYVRLIGGLGNQLFQLQFANWLSNNTDASIFLDTSFYKSANKAHERYWLGSINTQYSVDSLSDSCICYRRKLERLAYKFKMPLWLRLGSKFCFEGDLGYFGSNKESIYDGFWQDKRFVDINSILELSKKVDFINNHLKIRSVDISRVMIHVRRGDYVTDTRLLQKTHMVLEPEYYLTAMNVLREKYKISGFDIYSDDNICCENFVRKHNCHIVDTSNLSPPALLSAMSRYSYNIIANSTLSWWAAAISSVKGGVVVIPSDWNFFLSSEHLLLDGWQAI